MIKDFFRHRFLQLDLLSSNLTNLESSNPNRLIGSTKNEGSVERLKSLCALRMDDKELEINNKEKIDKYIITKKTRVLLKLKQNPVLVD